MKIKVINLYGFNKNYIVGKPKIILFLLRINYHANKNVFILH